MKRLQSEKLWFDQFSGRYKALIVDGSGSANPNVFSAADAFKKVFLDSTVSGYTGLYLPFVGGVPNNSYFRNGTPHHNTPSSSSWITK